MKLERMTFIVADDGPKPDTATFTMTLPEMVAIASLFGALNDYGVARLGLDAADESPYAALVAGVFNRYWFGGLEDLRPDFTLATLNDPTTTKESA